MPKRLLTPEVANDLHLLAHAESLERLKIASYKTGNNKGKMYAEYKEGRRKLRDIDLDVLADMTKKIVTSEDLSALDIEMTLKKDTNLTYKIKEIIKHANS